MSEQSTVDRDERRRRARVQGLIELKRCTIRKLTERIAELPEQIAVYERKLAALDETFSLHDVQVDPNTVRGLRHLSLHGYDYGQATRLVAAFIRRSEGVVFSTREVAEYLEREMGLPTRGDVPNNDFRARARKTLQEFARNGLLVKHADRHGFLGELWSRSLHGTVPVVSSGTAQGTNITS